MTRSLCRLPKKGQISYRLGIRVNRMDYYGAGESTTMAQTPMKRRSSKSPVPQVACALHPQATLTEVLTLAEAAAYLRVSEADVVRLAQQQDLPGRLIGTEWRFL